MHGQQNIKKWQKACRTFCVSWTSVVWFGY